MGIVKSGSISLRLRPLSNFSAATLYPTPNTLLDRASANSMVTPGACVIVTLASWVTAHNHTSLVQEASTGSDVFPVDMEDTAPVLSHMMSIWYPRGSGGPRCFNATTAFLASRRVIWWSSLKQSG